MHITLLRRPPARTLLVLASLAGILLACGKDVVIDPVEELPAALALVTPPPESVVAGDALSPAPVVELRTAAGEPLARRGERVVATLSGGTLGGTTSVDTDDRGRATFTDLTISTSESIAELRFACCNLPSIARMVSLAVPIAATGIAPHSPASVSGRAGSEMVPGPAVIVTDGNSMPVEGAVVHFSASSAGAIPVATIVTNAQGIAQLPSYRFDETFGSASVIARLDGTSRQARFDLSSTVGGEVTVVDEGFTYAGPVGQDFLMPPIQVTEGGVPQAGVEVRFTWIDQDGTPRAEHHLTGADGRTQGVALPIGAIPTENEFKVFVVGYTRSALLLRVVGARQLPLRFVSSLPPNLLPLENSEGRIFVSLNVLNSRGEPVPGIRILFPWDEANGIVDWWTMFGPEYMGPFFTDENGGAVLSWRVPPAPGTYRIEISNPGIAEPYVFTAIRE